MHTRAVKTALLLVVVLATACANDDPPVCGEEREFGAAALLVETFADVELGSDDVLVFSTTYDQATEETTLWARVHGLDGAPLGDAAALSIEADLYGAGAVATDDGWTLLWSEAGQLRLATLDAGGELSDPVVWADAGGTAFVFMLTATPSGLAAVWSVDEELFVGIAGTVVPLGRGQAPAIAAGNGDLGVVWADDARALWFATMSFAGALDEPQQIGTLADYLSPGICFDRDAYVVAYTERPEGTIGDVFVARFGFGLPTTQPLRVSDGGGQSWAPSIACGDGNHAVAWHHNLGGTIPGTDLGLSRIEFAAVTTNLIASTAPRPVEASADVQAMLPRVAPDRAGGYLVSWTEYGSAGYRTKLSSIDRCNL